MKSTSSGNIDSCNLTTSLHQLDEQFALGQTLGNQNIGLLIDSLIEVHLQLALTQKQPLSENKCKKSLETTTPESEQSSVSLHYKRQQLIEQLNQVLGISTSQIEVSQIDSESLELNSNEVIEYPQTELMTSVSNALSSAYTTISTAEQYDLNEDVFSAIFGDNYQGIEFKQNEIPPSTPVIDSYTESVNGVCVQLSSSLIPTDFHNQEQHQLFCKALDEIGKYHVCFGGIGDALVNLSGVLDEQSESGITIVAPANSVVAYQELFNTLNSITHRISKVYILPIGTARSERAYLRIALSQHPNCVRMGIVPSVDLEEKLWNSKLNIFKECGVAEHPNWVNNIQPIKLQDFQVVIAPKGSVFGTFRSKRNTLARSSWDTLMKITGLAEIHPVIIGTPDEQEYYPIGTHCIDKRSKNFSEQFALLRGADLVISADSWHKSFSALAGVATIVYDSLRGHDISLHEDTSSYVFIDPWSDITLIHNDTELCSTVDRILHEKGLLNRDSFTDLYQTINVRKQLPTRTNQYHRLTSLHQVFWSHDYLAMDSVLIKCSTALGDSLMITNVVRNIKSSYPHLKVYVSGNDVSRLVFLNNTDVEQFVERFSPLELELESSVDHVVEFNHIIDQLPEYYGGLHFMDILNNIAGIKSLHRELNYVATDEELMTSKQYLLSYLKQLPECKQEYIICGVQLGTEKDKTRSYQNSPRLIMELLDSYDNLVLVNFGTQNIDVNHPRYLDLSAKSISLREQISAVSFCSVFVSIDSAFFHVAHNLYKVPTLLLQSVTNEALIGNPASGTVYPFRNKASGCKSCYWACGKNCLDEVEPSLIVSAFSQMANNIAQGITWTPTADQHKTIDYDNKQDNWFIETYMSRCSGKTTSYTIKESSQPLPSYSTSWNGVEVEKAIIHTTDKLRQVNFQTAFS